MSFSLSQEAEKFLLATARAAIAKVLGEDSTPPETMPEDLQFSSGCFVTLNLHDALRGCIGTFRNDIAIVETVKEMAVQAALHDPRFFPLTKDELPLCHIEISILSPMIPATPEDIQVGRDGIYIQSNGRSGVLLPQVATDYGWDREEFLRHTCGKAGLPADAWSRPETKLFRFEAHIFSEED